LSEGHPELAIGFAREAIDLTGAMEDGFIASAAPVALCAALLEADAPGLDDAVELMVRRSGGPALPLMPGGSFRAKWLELLTRCSIALERPADASRAAQCARDAVASMGRLQMGSAMADRAAALVALDKGDAPLAARTALASADAADKAGIPVEAALSRTVAGRALARAGEPERAVLELQEAAGALHACGADRYRDAADQELRQLGRRVSRRSNPGDLGKAGVATLTGRERQVADLVVARRTNPEIAAALFLSPKTVETHIRHIFDKLDVTSRVDIARTLETASRPAG
jgi:DNA-binding CsgD family transcriptional regulator